MFLSGPRISPRFPFAVFSTSTPRYRYLRRDGSFSGRSPQVESRVSRRDSPPHESRRPARADLPRRGRSPALGLDVGRGFTLWLISNRRLQTADCCQWHLHSAVQSAASALWAVLPSGRSLRTGSQGAAGGPGVTGLHRPNPMAHEDDVGQSEAPASVPPATSHTATPPESTGPGQGVLESFQRQPFHRTRQHQVAAAAPIGIENGRGDLGVEHGGRGQAGGVGDAPVRHNLLRVARIPHRRQRIGRQVGGKPDDRSSIQVPPRSKLRGLQTVDFLAAAELVELAAEYFDVAFVPGLPVVPK
jgi:hypothetical protein